MVHRGTNTAKGEQSIIECRLSDSTNSVCKQTDTCTLVRSLILVNVDLRNEII